MEWHGTAASSLWPDRGGLQVRGGGLDAEHVVAVDSGYVHWLALAHGASLARSCLAYQEATWHLMLCQHQAWTAVGSNRSNSSCASLCAREPHLILSGELVNPWQHASYWPSQHCEPGTIRQGRDQVTAKRAWLHQAASWKA